MLSISDLKTCYLINAMRITTHNVYGNRVGLEKVWSNRDLDEKQAEAHSLCLQEVHEDDLKALLKKHGLDPELQNHPRRIQETDDLIISWLEDFVQLPHKAARPGQIYMVNIIPKHELEFADPNRKEVQIMPNFSPPFLIQPLLERIMQIEETHPAGLSLLLRDKLGKIFNLVNMHLTAFTSQANRRFQLQTIINRIREATPPQREPEAILLGDLNPSPLFGERDLGNQLKESGYESPFRQEDHTYKHSLGKRRLDLIALSKAGTFKFAEYKVGEEKNSDHRLVSADIE